MRFLVLGGCVGYGAFIGVFDGGLSRAQSLIFGLDAVLFGLFALYTHAHFKRHPHPDYPLRAVGLFADHGAALACLAVTGHDAGALAWLPLFIIQGVGIRFGVRWLFASQAIGVVSVGVICAVNPFFRDNATVGLGAVLSVLVLPLYFALLARREQRIKAALQEARLDAEAANAAKGRFVAMISHELRTPLTGISGLNELLRKQELPDHTQQMLAEQHAATALMLTMVNDVLDLSKIEDGRMQLQEVDFDPQELALSVLQALSFQAKRKGLLVRVELDASVPEVLSGSPFHVSRILQNLLGNAIKFTAEGSITLRVTRIARALSDNGTVSVRFEVIDTGIGIPEAALPRIFDRFYQVDAAVTRRFGGTGLGTSLVKEFCELLGGSVQLESRLGQGTRCVVSIPFMPRKGGAAITGTSERGASVVALAQGIEDWQEVQAQLVNAGARVYQVSESEGSSSHAVRAIPSTAVLLLGKAPSKEAAATITAMNLADPAYILLGAQDHVEQWWWRASSRVVFGARTDSSLGRALHLATLGTPSRLAGDLGLTERPQSSVPKQPAKSVLVAEDTTTIQLVMRVTLESAGFAVTVAGDGAEALRLAASQRYDVIVLDWNMPKVDGIEVLRNLRNGTGPNSATPVVVATAAPSQQLVDEAADVGAQFVLAKPFEGQELVDILEGALACGARAPVAARIVHDALVSDPNSEVAPVLDFVALEGPDSIFKTVDPAALVGAFMRDVEKNKELLTKAAATADLYLFRASIHSLAGYAGTFGARWLQSLLAAAPRDEGELRTQGDAAVRELCEAMSATSRALDEWLKASVYEAQ